MANPSTCFDNFIGIRGCDSEAPGSGYYIQDLPGITLKKAASTAPDGTGEDLLRDRISFATMHVVDEFRQFLDPMFRADTMIESRFIGEVLEPVTYENTAAVERGIKVKRHGGPLTRTHIQRVFITAQDPGAYELKIIDGSITKTFDFTVVTAGVRVEVCTEYTAEAKDVLVVVDNTSLQVAKTKIKRSGCACSGRKLFGQLTVFGWDGAQNRNETYGIQADIQVHCDQDQLLCILKKKMGLPILYRAGAAIMSEIANTDRLNYYTLVENKEHAFELEKQFTEEYEKRLKSLTKGVIPMLRNIDKHCVKCNMGTWRSALP